jgi:hypothetical protein
MPLSLLKLMVQSRLGVANIKLLIFYYRIFYFRMVWFFGGITTPNEVALPPELSSPKL